MTDFGVRAEAGDASAANQATQITAEEAIQAAVEALTATERVVPVNAQVFDNLQASYTSAEIDTAAYRKFLLRVILGVTLAPGTIKINIQCSHDGATWENVVMIPFGSLMYEDTAGAKNECACGDCIGAKMRINVVTTGTDATNKFTLTCKMSLKR
jgi:hypothetical protein